MAATLITVTGTLVDSSGAAWDGATVIVQLVPGFGTPITHYTWNGAPFTLRQEFTTTGNTFSIQLQANNDIQPIDSMWQFVISRSPATPAIVITKVFNSKSGTTFDISADFHSAPLPAPANSSNVQLIQAPDQATALAESAQNPNAIYWWV